MVWDKGLDVSIQSFRLGVLRRLILHRSEIRTIISREPRIVIDYEIDPALRDIDFPQDKDIKERRKMLETYQVAWANLQNEDPGLPSVLSKSI
jgi:hypothetical protein